MTSKATAVKDHPILFKGRLVRAILEGRKRQTRRVIRPYPPEGCTINYGLGNETWMDEEERTPLRHLWEAWSGPVFQKQLQLVSGGDARLLHLFRVSGADLMLGRYGQ